MFQEVLLFVHSLRVYDKTRQRAVQLQQNVVRNSNKIYTFPPKTQQTNSYIVSNLRLCSNWIYEFIQIGNYNNLFENLKLLFVRDRPNRRGNFLFHFENESICIEKHLFLSFKLRVRIQVRSNLPSIYTKIIDFI